jgi:hypothetical protein
MARLSGHTGLKLSIRRLAFYARQPARYFHYRRYHRGGGELSSNFIDVADLFAPCFARRAKERMVVLVSWS